ncbi:NusA-like transcription termination signal-binding factor [Candidatus Woesearchaeota archaeon]|nr:NusA-like transcription termination signal-binding factor [Candidatus Woesearchaeota archaeon]
MKTKYDVQTLQIMTMFEKITRAKLKDCFTNKDKLYFIVQHGELRKALGDKKENVQKLVKATNRNIKIVEFNPNVLDFVKNIMHPLKMEDINMIEGIITIKGTDTKTKGLMIGARAQNLRNYEDIVKKYFEEIKEIKVV